MAVCRGRARRLVAWAVCVAAVAAALGWWFYDPLAPSHYDVLGIARDASPKQIKKAFRVASLRAHPDKGPSDSGDASAYTKFLDVVEARDTLLDASKRRRYDAWLAARDIAHEQERVRRWHALLSFPEAAANRVLGLRQSLPSLLTVWHALFGLAVAALMLDWLAPVVADAVTCGSCRRRRRATTGAGRTLGSRATTAGNHPSARLEAVPTPIPTSESPLPATGNPSLDAPAAALLGRSAEVPGPAGADASACVATGNAVSDMMRVRAAQQAAYDAAMRASGLRSKQRPRASRARGQRLRS